MPNDTRTKESAVVAIDTSALLRFLHLGRTDLLKLHPMTFVATETVKGEVAKLGQLAGYKRAVSQCHFIHERLSRHERRLRDHFVMVNKQDLGESSVIAIALNRGHGIALQDKGAIRFATGLTMSLGVSMPILRVESIFAELVMRGVLTVEQVDGMLHDLAQNHKFRLKIGSITEVL